jgi:hypothetical protein
LKISFFILFAFFLSVHPAKGADPFTIRLNNSSPVQFCVDPVLVAKDLTIDGIPNIQGMKISFTQGYVAGEDELVYSGGLTKSYPTPGTLLLTGSTLIQDYIDAIRTITYVNTKSTPTIGIRKITISLDDVDYLPETGHFYRYISKTGISWMNARDEAASSAMMYYGLKGYLATVTSQAENDFIKLKTKGVGWIGGSDEAVEGTWRWVTGPEGLEESGNGRIFWIGRYNDSGAGPYQGRYTNWNTNEPNQSGNEDYAHITLFSGNPFNSYKWNDLPNIGGNGDYAPQGYLIEWGGSAGEQDLNLSATLDLQVNTMLFKTGAIAPICEGESVTLNQPDTNPIPGTYIWSPTETLTGFALPNPVASPVVSTTYTVAATRGDCSNSAQFVVTVNPKPLSLLNAVENICKGASITLDPGEHKSYSWSNGAATRTIVVTDPGEYRLTLTTDKGCTGKSAAMVIVHEFPTVDFSNLDSLVCGNPRSTLVNIGTTGTIWSLSSVDNNATISGLNVSVPQDGVYPMIYKSALYPGCNTTKQFNLAFYKTPKVSFSINSTECYGYNLDVLYTGDADKEKSQFTWIFRGDTIADGIGHYQKNIPLGINQANRKLELQVVDRGCPGLPEIAEINVIPTVSLTVKNPLLCQPDYFEFLAANTETGVTYDWDFGDGTKGSGSTLKHNYAIPGKYDVRMTVTTDKNCTNTALVKEMVFVAPVPDVSFSLSPNDCLNPGVNEISYTGLIGTDKDKYFWDLTGFDPSEILTDPLQTRGPFRFDLKTQPQVNLGLKVVSEFGCESPLKNILLKRKPDFSILADVYAGCIPFEPTLSGKMPGSDQVDQVDFIWDFGDGNSGSGSPVSHTYLIADKKHTVTLSGRSSVTGCSNQTVINDSLKTYPKPVASFSMDHDVVYNDKPTVNFSNSSIGASSYFWDFGDQITSEEKNPGHNYSVTGYKTVLLDVMNEFGCNDTVTHKLLVAFDRIFPPNGFSPNAPDPVDRIFLLHSEGITSVGYHFTVLSRWNDLIFEVQDEIAGWDGRMKNGSYAPSGTYLWVLSYTDFLGRKHRQTGVVTLVY